METVYLCCCYDCVFPQQHDFFRPAGSDSQSPQLHLEVTPQASTDNQASGAGQPNTVVASQLQDLPGKYYMNHHSEISLTTHRWLTGHKS